MLKISRAIHDDLIAHARADFPIDACGMLGGVPEGSHVFLDVIALLGTKGQNQTEKPVRVVGYRVDRTDYYVATDRFDLTAEDVALAYKLRWDIEIFFGWWKQHLNVYHMVARSPHGLMAQMMTETNHSGGQIPITNHATPRPPSNASP